MNDMNRQLTEEIFCMLFIILFVYTGLSKLWDTETFIAQLSQTRMLKPFAGFLSIALPLTELLIAVMLATNRWRLAGLYGFTILMAAFTVYIIVILNFSKKVPCSCGGIIVYLGWRSHLLLNSVFIAMGLGAIRLHRKHQRNGNDAMAAAA